jgi:hypothetical protein
LFRRTFLAGALALTALAVPPSIAGAARHAHKRVCAEATGPRAACHAEVVVDPNANPLVTPTPTSGFQPADLQAA